jgi:hypothetical protein
MEETPSPLRGRAFDALGAVSPSNGAGVRGLEIHSASPLSPPVKGGEARELFHRSEVNLRHRILGRSHNASGALDDEISQDGIYFGSQTGRNSLMRLRIRTHPL